MLIPSSLVHMREIQRDIKEQLFLTWVPRTSALFMGKFQGFRELGWGKKYYKFIVTNLEVKFSYSFKNECRQQRNLWHIDSENFC